MPIALVVPVKNFQKTDAKSDTKKTTSKNDTKKNDTRKRHQLTGHRERRLETEFRKLSGKLYLETDGDIKTATSPID
jgi:hypothetical protein